jgi:nucleoside-triphosphatase THEP1
MLKYSMKCEPWAKLNLNTETLRRLGLPTHQYGELQLRLASTAILSQPVGPCEAAWHLLKYDIVEFSWPPGDYYHTNPPKTRRQQVGNKKHAGKTIPPVDIYTDRKPPYEDLTIFEYFDTVEVYKNKSSETKKAQNHPGASRDQSGRLVVPRPADDNFITMFSDPNPARDPESFCYNLLLGHEPISSEAYILDPPPGSIPGPRQGRTHNLSQTYFEQCQKNGVFSTFEELMNLIQEQYIDFGFRTRDDPYLMATDMLTHDEYVWTHGFDVTAQNMQQPLPTNTTVMSDEIQRNLNERAAEIFGAEHNEFGPGIMNATTTQEQEAFLTQLKQRAQSTLAADPALRNGGLFFLTGGAGVGKSFLCKRFMQWARTNDLNTLTGAFTGAAAVRLSKLAKTVHSLFTIKVKAYDMLADLNMHSIEGRLLLLANVIIIDEISMLNAKQFDEVLHRLRQVTNTNDTRDAIKQKLVLMVGDLAQLPPVCFCKCNKKRNGHQHLQQPAAAPVLPQHPRAPLLRRYRMRRTTTMRSHPSVRPAT